MNETDVQQEFEGFQPYPNYTVVQCRAFTGHGRKWNCKAPETVACDGCLFEIRSTSAAQGGGGAGSRSAGADGAEEEEEAEHEEIEGAEEQDNEDEEGQESDQDELPKPYVHTRVSSMHTRRYDCTG